MNIDLPHYHLQNSVVDLRGKFNKFWTDSQCQACSGEFTPKETYYSVSKRGTIRGFHFQRHPFNIAKLVKVISGEILDVSFSLEDSSKRLFNSYILTEESAGLMIPSHFAHGFQVLSDSATVLYLTNGHFQESHDAGIHHSIFADWKNIPKIVSQRDSLFSTVPEGF
jgi:dTDP-4-dehydrorhamnose 3,5-epimerase